MEKLIITITAPTGYTLDQATNFVNEAIQAENLVRDNGILILVDRVTESEFNKGPIFSAGRYDTLIRKMVLDLKNYGLQIYLSNLIYSVFQFYDEEKITDKDLSTVHDIKQGNIFSILTDAYLKIKHILHTI
jgi:hypothetical protein